MKTILLLACIAYLSTAATYNISTYTYKTVGDLKIDLDVYTPPTAPPANGYPIFFAIHGGGDFQGSKQTAFTATELAEVTARGWAIVSINYRMLPGIVLQDIVEDIQDSYQWIQNELPKILKVDLNRLTVFGQSAGGGLAVMSAYLLSPRPQAVIAFYSFCTNWTDPYSYKPGTPVDPVIVAAANKLAVPVVTEYFVTNSTDPKNAMWGAALTFWRVGGRKTGW